ncbi:MAG: hypothetical protein ACSLE9_14695 [Burkholderiaceae bacterium]
MPGKAGRGRRMGRMSATCILNTHSMPSATGWHSRIPGCAGTVASTLFIASTMLRWRKAAIDSSARTGHSSVTHTGAGSIA